MQRGGPWKLQSDDRIPSPNGGGPYTDRRLRKRGGPSVQIRGPLGREEAPVQIRRPIGRKEVPVQLEIF